MQRMWWLQGYLEFGEEKLGDSSHSTAGLHNFPCQNMTDPRGCYEMTTGTKALEALPVLRD